MLRRAFVSFLVTTLMAAALGSAQGQTFSILYDFGSKAGDPSRPSSSGVIAQARDGNLYTTTPAGGAYNYGAVFKITPSGTMTVVHSFDFDATWGPLSPSSGLTLGRNGNFYGTSTLGGIGNEGTVFTITPTGTVTVLHTFTDGNDGAHPSAPPIQGTDGNWYGTAATAEAVGGFGTVYKLTPSGAFTTLHLFNNTDGSSPQTPLVQGTDGNFYGTTYGGGAFGLGEVFRITAGGKLSVLHSFDRTDGAYPVGALIQGIDGNFYGMTSEGGSASRGVAFKVSAAGTFAVINSVDVSTPYAGLVQASDGNLYGTNFANVFKMTPAGALSVLYSFDTANGPALPYVAPVQHTNGVLYGDTESGGTGGVSPCAIASCGVFYSLNWKLRPFISLLPYSGKIGSKIGILGQGFNNSSVVKFGGTRATTVTSSGTTYLTATVPAAALTGPVTVTSGTTTLTSLRTFKVLPTITSFSPQAGSVGIPVSISGNGLKKTSKVTFAGKPAAFTVISDTNVSADVPAGATTGKIAVTTNGGSANSPTSFTVN